jgi:Domain of unknown function (DUF4440)
MSTAIRRTTFVGFAQLVAFAAFLALPVCSVSQDRQVGTNAGRDEDDIKQLISMYAKAADEADPALASRIWCDSSDDSLINPVGRWHGVEEILGFYRHEMGDRYSSRNLKISNISVRVYTDAAWAEFNWDFSATRRKEKKDRQSHSMVWKPRFIARTSTGGVWFMFIIPRCPLKRRREQNERGRFMKPSASLAADGRRIRFGTRSNESAGALDSKKAMIR